MSTIKANYILDAAGGNTATINGKLPIAIGDVPAGGTGLTLLGTIATTSGSSVTLSGLTLTPYKQLQALFTGVSGTTLAPNMRINGYAFTQLTSSTVTDYVVGGVIIDLATGIFFGGSSLNNSSNASFNFFGGGGLSGLTTASTSITFTISAGTFDAGTITIYGVK